MLHEFWAVTMTSVYHISDVLDKYNEPTVEKVALCGFSLVKKGERFTGAKLIGITPFFIVLFDTHQEIDGEFIPGLFVANNTSGVVGLFTTKEAAMKCLGESNGTICDLRWAKDTREVLNAIPKNHPVFKVSTLFEMRLRIGYSH